jgi:L-asparaginase/Glu-tRNA(Gln) amidotransferase subunit D
MTASSGEHRERAIGLVLSGGTIGAERHGSVLSVGPRATSAEAGLVASAWPEAGEPRVAVAASPRKLSENLTPVDWPAIAGAARRLIEVDDVDGVLVLHGTDTMAYTAAALSFLLCDVDRPIVLTGSRLAAEQPGSDAAANVRAALVALLALRSGTYVALFDGGDAPARIHLATRVRKAPSGGETFTSVNRQPVATVQRDRLTPLEPYAHRVGERSIQDVDEHVLALRLYPGLDFDAADDAAQRAGVRGVVVELYPSATGPDTADRFSLPRFIARCAERDVVVATTSPGAPPSGASVYETTVAIADAGGLNLRDMSTETATVKMMWALAQSQRPQDVRRLMLRAIAGELAPTARRRTIQSR